MRTDIVTYLSTSRVIAVESNDVAEKAVQKLGQFSRIEVYLFIVGKRNKFVVVAKVLGV